MPFVHVPALPHHSHEITHFLQVLSYKVCQDSSSRLALHCLLMFTLNMLKLHSTLALQRFNRVSHRTLSNHLLNQTHFLP